MDSIQMSDIHSKVSLKAVENVTITIQRSHIFLLYFRPLLRVNSERIRFCFPYLYIKKKTPVENELRMSFLKSIQCLIFNLFNLWGIISFSYF